MIVDGEEATDPRQGTAATANGRATHVGEGVDAANAAWNFSGQAAAAFGQHVRRSVPLYDEGHRLVCDVSDFFVRDGSIVYDIGTSLGELLGKLSDRHRQHPATRWIGIDAEPDMVTRARAALSDEPNVRIDLGDIAAYDLSACDFVVSYYCLQFVPPRYRQAAVTKIYDALHPGGAFMLFEKVRSEDARFQELVSSLYVEFKLEQSYSAQEVVAKSRSLKGVLEPYSSAENRTLLENAGFSAVTTLFRYLCFEGVLAIKR